MRWMVGAILLAGLVGCQSRTSAYMRNQGSEIPTPYLKALANEEGISVEEARKMVVDRRGQLGTITAQDIQAGRHPKEYGAHAPVNPMPSR